MHQMRKSFIVSKLVLCSKLFSHNSAPLAEGEETHQTVTNYVCVSAEGQIAVDTTACITECASFQPAASNLFQFLEILKLVSLISYNFS